MESQQSLKFGDLYPVREISAKLPSRPSRATVYRWIARGCRGIKLRTVAIGKRQYTCDGWLWDFLQRKQINDKELEERAVRLGL